MQVRILAEYPYSVAFGGLELQCQRSVDALSRLSQDVSLLDYHTRNDEFDVLHIFGNPPSMHEICLQSFGKKKIIISAVCGAKAPGVVSGKLNHIFSSLVGCFGEMTNYTRMREMFEMADIVICLNELERRFLCSYFGISGEKIRQIPNGVAQIYFEADSKLFKEEYGLSNYVLFTGNIIERKNPLLLARALEALGENGVFIGEAFVGDESYLAQFEEIISRNSTLHWIKGLEPDSEMLASAYAGCRVFCLPSVSETQPQAALEAMAVGRPVILGKQPYALQSPFDSVLKCDFSVQGIKNALQTEHRIIRLSDAYTWENVGAQILSSYGTLV